MGLLQLTYLKEGGGPCLFSQRVLFVRPSLFDPPILRRQKCELYRSSPPLVFSLSLPWLGPCPNATAMPSSLGMTSDSEYSRNSTLHFLTDDTILAVLVGTITLGTNT